METNKTLNYKKWKQRFYCAFHSCSNNTKDTYENIFMIPFAKPCSQYISTIINRAVKHDVDTCVACSKCKRWMAFCKRADARFQQLSDITNKTFICNQHFTETCGPTDIYPDPVLECREYYLLDGVRRHRTHKRSVEIQIEECRVSAVNDQDSAQPKDISIDEVRRMAQKRSVEIQIEESRVSAVSDQDSAQPKDIPVACESPPSKRPRNNPTSVKSLKQLFFDSMGLGIFSNNFMCQFNQEIIKVQLHKEIFCVIAKDYSINIEVYGEFLPDNHAIWSTINKHIDPTKDDYIQILKNLQKTWQLCKYYVISKATSEFRDTKICPVGSDAVSQLMKMVQHCEKICILAVCTSCKKISTKSKRNATNATKRLELKKRTNIRYLTHREAIDCVRRARRTLYIHQRRSKRIKDKMQNLISSRGEILTNADNADFLKILLDNNDDESSNNNRDSKIDMTKLFFHEQIKAAKAKSPHGHRWHPLLLKWCLYLKAKSSSTYAALRNVITLPSEKRLYQIQAHTHIRPGFQDEVLASLVQEFDSAGPENHTKYCSILYDEIKIKEDLVYKSSTNELIGFVQLSNVDQLLTDISLEASGALRNETELATHVLQLMVRGITTNILSTYAYFPTKTLQAKNLFPILIEAVEKLERKDIKVLAFVSDGAAANRALYRMMADDTANWWTVNPYARDRKIFFVCDAPHLLKTTRNCLSNSGSHKKTRLLWNNGKHLEWQHIKMAYQRDLCDGFRKLIKITDEHIYLTPCSLMKVRLAAQVLSRRMGVALRSMNSPYLSETIIFVELFNKWFDIMNERNLHESERSRNEDIGPFYNADDIRLKWLNTDFIEYLNTWGKNVMERAGTFTKSERSKMLLSKETVDGLKITAQSISALVKFMLAEGAKFVLTYKFNQDPLELELSKQRGAGGCNTNPCVMRYGDNAAKLKSMKMAKKEIAFAGRGNITKYTGKQRHTAA